MMEIPDNVTAKAVVTLWEDEKGIYWHVELTPPQPEGILIGKLPFCVHRAAMIMAVDFQKELGKFKPKPPACPDCGSEMVPVDD